MPQHACTRCGVPGHNRRTCPEGPTPPVTKPRRYFRRAVDEPSRVLPLPSVEIPDPRYHELPPAEAERILASLRPIERACSGQPLDSLLLSVYLRGMLDASLALEAGRAEAVGR